MIKRIFNIVKVSNNLDDFSYKMDNNFCAYPTKIKLVSEAIS